VEYEPLSLSFYEQSSLSLAEQLIGKLLLKQTEEGLAGGYIVETEAYAGPMDRAAHSYNNRRTARTEVMFGPAGYVYTYQMHTHCLVNIVAARPEEPQAVLIRGIEPYVGIELMQRRRGTLKHERDLSNGPGKLCKALGITMADYGHKITERPLWIAEGKSYQDVTTGPRIGIPNTGEAKDYPWRFFVQAHPNVSRG